MSWHRYQVNQLDQELEGRLQEQSEYEDYRRSGLSMHEASHMTPAQIQAVARRNMAANIAAAKANAELDLDHLEAAARRNEIPNVRLTTKADLRSVYAALKAGGIIRFMPAALAGASWF